MNDSVDATIPVEDDFRAAIDAGKGNDWYDDALSAYAQWLESAGRLVLHPEGGWHREADAARMFRQAGTEADALTNLALAHELQGQPDKARTLYQKALLRDPRQSAAQKNLEALETTVPAPASVAPPPAPEKSP